MPRVAGGGRLADPRVLLELGERPRDALDPELVIVLAHAPEPAAHVPARSGSGYGRLLVCRVRNLALRSGLRTLMDD
jgi:hypothetical protein